MAYAVLAARNNIMGESKYPITTNKEEFHKRLNRAAVERLTDGQRSMFVAPAYDYRGGENDGYGRHSAELVFAEKRNGIVIEARFYTGWNIRRDTLVMDGKNIEFMCTGYYYHYPTKEQASEYAHHTEECVLSGGACWGEAGSALYGDVLRDKLINEGSPAIWDDIDKQFKFIEEDKE